MFDALANSICLPRMLQSGIHDSNRLQTGFPLRITAGMTFYESINVRRYSRFFKSQHAMDVLDYGTGTMRNAVYMAQEGFSVYNSITQPPEDGGRVVLQQVRAIIMKEDMEVYHGSGNVFAKS
jgi:hypothetical protein